MSAQELPFLQELEEKVEVTFLLPREKHIEQAKSSSSIPERLVPLRRRHRTSRQNHHRPNRNPNSPN